MRPGMGDGLGGRWAAAQALAWGLLHGGALYFAVEFGGWFVGR